MAIAIPRGEDYIIAMLRMLVSFPVSLGLLGTTATALLGESTNLGFYPSMCVDSLRFDNVVSPLASSI